MPAPQSPFPGMDPYLEREWASIRASMVVYASDQLEEQLPEQLIPRVQERLVPEALIRTPRSAYPEVKRAERPGRGRTATAVLARTKAAEPIIIEADEQATETVLHIIEGGKDERLVTVLEILSLTNKLPGEGQNEYLRTQDEVRMAGASMVEIDLLRRGDHVLAVPGSLLPARHQTPYMVCVRRGWEPMRWEIYPIPLPSPLPTISIPLRQEDEDIKLDLQAILEQAYRKGRYHLSIDYGERLEPPLGRVEAKWARGLLKTGKKG